jgi:DNA (cytosine-5)-methyltransferase 1
VLRSRADFLTARQIAALAERDGVAGLSLAAVLGHLRHLEQDFELEIAEPGPAPGDGPAYRLGGFKAFLGQREHIRHELFAAARGTIS